MNDQLRQTDDPPEAGWPVEVGDDRYGTVLTPESTLSRITQQGKHAVTTAKPRQQPLSDVSASDNQ